MTLNSVIAVILRYSADFGSIGANYIKVVEDRPIPSCSFSALTLLIGLFDP